MSISYRGARLLAGVFAPTLLLLLGSQGTTQKAVTQPVREEPTYEDRSGKVFAPGGVIVVLEQPASPVDLRELNREIGARVEEDLP